MNLLARFSWIVVVAVALGISWWSLYAVGRYIGMPPLPAAGVSTVFDGAALVAAHIALKHAEKHGDTGLAARVSVMLLVLGSAFLNGFHASILRDRLPAYMLFAMPPVVSWLIFELHTRWIRRDALISAGRVARPLPVFGHNVWVDHPFSTYRIRRKITANHRDDAARSSMFTLGQVLADITSRADAIRIASAATDSVDPARVFMWLMENRRWIPGQFQGIDQAFVRRQLGQMQRRDKIIENVHQPGLPAIQGGFTPDSARLQDVFTGQEPE
jgi:Protein of unknown function (DUF2637)